MTPLWHDDILACYPDVLARLKSLPQIKKVIEAKELSEIDNKAIAPIDGAVYVVLDSITPTAGSDGTKRGQDIQIGFSVILAKQQYNPTPKLDGVGQTLTAICKAMIGFEPVKDGRALTLTPFVQEQGLAIRYQQNYALFPLRFSTTVAV